MKAWCCRARCSRNWVQLHRARSDGHDVDALVKTLRSLRNHRATSKGHQFPCTSSRKGKGRLCARRADRSSGTGPARSTRPAARSSRTRPGPTFSQVFGQWLCDMAAGGPAPGRHHPAMREGSGMVEFSQRFPTLFRRRHRRAARGDLRRRLSPARASNRWSRSTRPSCSARYDQLIHDVALQNLPVVFALDRAGLVGGDGVDAPGRVRPVLPALHPNMVIMAPADENECRQMLYGDHDRGSRGGAIPARHRTGRGETTMAALPVGRGEVVAKAVRGSPSRCFGTLLDSAWSSASGWITTVVNMRFVKPLDARELVLLPDRAPPRAGDDRGECRRGGPAPAWPSCSPPHGQNCRSSWSAFRTTSSSTVRASELPGGRRTGPGGLSAYDRTVVDHPEFRPGPAGRRVHCFPGTGPLGSPAAAAGCCTGQLV